MEVWREELYANELYHYGVKGMKWRHRKTPDNLNDKKEYKPLHAVNRWEQYYDKRIYGTRHKYNKEGSKKGKKLFTHYTRHNERRAKNAIKNILDRLGNLPLKALKR